MTDMADSDGTKRTDYSHRTSITIERQLCNHYHRMSVFPVDYLDGISYQITDVAICARNYVHIT